SYMQELDEWTDQSVIEPLRYAWAKGPDEAEQVAEGLVRKAIRQKVLESYRNGQQAGPAKRQAYATR
ncbi:MAG TPA: hypothetical protein VNL15_00795, partial [Dehalococcoidia bacterium]|nr:hypothetical protein [Dehalococcoidia bacterium]